MLTQEFPHTALRGHAHLWSGSSFQGAFLRIPQVASFLLGADKESEQTLFAKGSHPDILLFPDDGEKIKVEDARKIVQHVAMSPQGGMHLVLIENIDRMGEEAANLLLKTIEEPSSFVYFLCSTEHYENVLPTLISRMTVHTVPLRTFTDAELSKAISHWQLPWQVDNLKMIIPAGEGILYKMIKEYKEEGSFTMYDFLFKLQSTYVDILAPNTSFYSIASSLSFLYDKKEVDTTHTELFFFTFEAHLAKLVVQYISKNDKDRIDKVISIQQGLKQLKADLKANMHKKLATHHFILSSVL